MSLEANSSIFFNIMHKVTSYFMILCFKEQLKLTECCSGLRTSGNRALNDFLFIRLIIIICCLICTSHQCHYIIICDRPREKGPSWSKHNFPEIAKNGI